MIYQEESDKLHALMSNNMVLRSANTTPTLGKKVVASKPIYANIELDNKQQFSSPEDDIIPVIEVDDPDATPKLEKRPGMSQIISSLKWRFGNHSGRKKGKKTKAVPGRESCSSRLLWNSNGHWKDDWFTYEDGMLAGYKEQGVKPADVTINIKTSKLTIYGADEFMRKLNLFKITTVCNVAHIFAAWSEEQYETWVEILSYAVGKKFEQVSFNIGNDRRLEEESFDNDIIPYERAMEKERKGKDKSKRLTDSRIDNNDSGNDGDESGLESSVSSLSLFESRKRTEKERKLELGRRGSIPEKHIKSEIELFSRSLSDKDLLQHFVKADRKKDSVTSTPSLEYQAFPQRPTSLVIPRKTGRTTPEKIKSPKREEYLQVSGKGVEINISKPLLRAQTPSVDHDDSALSTPEYYMTLNNQVRHSRQCSTDTYLHLNDVAIDSSSSGHTVDIVDTPVQPKYSVGSFCSDDNIGEYPAINTTSIVEVRNKLEDTLREETLLRKRRNSLNLEREHVKDTIDELRDKRGSKDVTEQMDRTNQIDHLENKMNDLEKEIKNIDKKICVAFDPTPCNVKKRKPSSQNKLNANNIMSKIRSAKPNLMVHSHSIESLTSTASHDSSLGRESPYSSHKHETDKPSYIPTVRTVKEGTSDDSSHSPSGLEELMRTTQRLENGEFQTKKNDPELANRSKSLSSVDKMVPSQQSRHTHSLANAELIIEDFEKFSAMLLKNQQVKPTDIIDV